jgi:hypothetical protein
MNKLDTLIKKRELLRKEEHELTQEIKLQRKRVLGKSGSKRKEIDKRLFDKIKELQAQMRTIRLSAKKALRNRGCTTKEISKILGVSYSQLVVAQRIIERKAYYANRTEEMIQSPYHGKIANLIDSWKRELNSISKERDPRDILETCIHHLDRILEKP